MPFVFFASFTGTVGSPVHLEKEGEGRICKVLGINTIVDHFVSKPD